MVPCLNTNKEWELIKVYIRSFYIQRTKTVSAFSDSAARISIGFVERYLERAISAI